MFIDIFDLKDVLVKTFVSNVTFYFLFDVTWMTNVFTNKSKISMNMNVKTFYWSQNLQLC